MHKVLPIGLAVLFAAATAYAATIPAFGDVDTDGDGAISQQEAASVELVNQQFNTADINNDGSLDAVEYSTIGQ